VKSRFETLGSLLRWLFIAAAAALAVFSLRHPSAKWAYLAGSFTQALIVCGFLQAWLGGPKRHFWFGFSAAAASVALLMRIDLPSLLELVPAAADAGLAELPALRWVRLDRLNSPREALTATAGAYTVIAVGAACGLYLGRAARQLGNR
jgi:hypothetical protein